MEAGVRASILRSVTGLPAGPSGSDRAVLINPLLAHLECKPLSVLLGGKLAHMTRYITGLFVRRRRGDDRFGNPRAGIVMMLSGSRNLVLFVDFREHGRGFFIVPSCSKKPQKMPCLYPKMRKIDSVKLAGFFAYRSLTR